jgi:3-oxoacid CoA-transferase
VHKADAYGNCQFRYTTQNFSSVMARAAKLTIVEGRPNPIIRSLPGANSFIAEEIVPVGAIDPQHVHLPGVYVDRIVPATAPKEIEFRTVARSKDAAVGKLLLLFTITNDNQFTIRKMSMLRSAREVRPENGEKGS